MSAQLQSILRRGQAFLQSTSSGTDATRSTKGTFITAPKGTLFPKVDPSIDGEDCEHDCESCTVRYPAKWSIDEDEELYGHVKGWATHLVVATGKTDWTRDVEDEKGSVMEAVVKCGVTPNNGRLMLSASNMPLPHGHYGLPEHDCPTTVLLLPSFTIVANVTPSSVPDLIRGFIDSAPTTTTPLSALPEPSEITTNGSSKRSAPTPTTDHNQPHETSPSSAKGLTRPVSPIIPHPFSSCPCPHLAVILLCSQKTRDARCGQSAPLLRREFERHLRHLGLYRDLHDERPGGVGIYFISHVGGHKFAANVMVYRRGAINRDGNDDGDKAIGSAEASQGIWLARVRPEDCEGIVKFTVLKGKVVKPDRQLRGGFDRARALISW